MTATDLKLERLLDDVVEAVRTGECILFLGSGVHWSPPKDSRFVYPDAERPASAKELRDRLATLSRWDERYRRDDEEQPPERWELARTALDFEIEFSRERLVQEVRQSVDAEKRPSPVLDALAQLDFPLIVTTNYDRLFERALRRHDKDPQIAVYSPQPAPLAEAHQPTPKRPFLFKLHGDVDNEPSIVITDEDYIQFVLRMSDRDPNVGAVPTTLTYFFKIWPTLFVGYSLMDYNLRLLFKTLRWRIDESRTPSTYSVDIRPDPLIVAVWQQERKLVKFIAQDVWTFVPALYQRVKGQELAP